MSHVDPPFAAELAELAAIGRQRRRPVIDSPDGRRIALADAGRRTLINWASNDYLACVTRLVVRNGAFRALRSYGAGSGAARLLGGGLRLHRNLELRAARFLGREDALLTTSGFQANLALLTTLAGEPGDALILDRLCHASLYDGARLSAGQLLRFRHNDVQDLERQLERSASARRRIVVVEAVYSMDGDEAPLAAVADACRRHGARLVVDEAHALGVLGPGGRGLCAELGLKPDAVVATCSKALGAQGGLIVGDRDLVELVVNRGRAFIYSTAPVPAASGAALAALRWLDEHPEAPAELLASAAALRADLRAAGWQVPDGRTPIVPLIVGDEAAALALAQGLRDLGHHAPAIRPPTVPEGACRLRLTITAAHRAVDRRRLIAALTRLRPAPGASLPVGGIDTSSADIT